MIYICDKIIYMNLVGRYRGRETRKCPRCGEKCLQTQPSCTECGLVFSRLDDCTNEAAVKRLKNREKENVLMVKKVPKDKKYWKLLLYSILFGLFGAQYFYVYRWKTGLYMLTSIILTFLFGVYFNAFFLTWPEVLKYAFVTYVGIYAVIWLYSIVQILFRKFKIPVSLPYKEFKMEESK